ncbi:hypothetical protein M422DRAFT_33188 [Sphaerobolus stellatus SS14]|uniref:Uncharacterized protein n=1 Tax=Sphaerobolus stellatus (strain SS14) TaxID=990650 RepID=A0A0C9VAI7_SPHS4|nr:hypothetical protein M422DRAFT_33188 [Sphaerobolus stellatus SS14]
MFISYTPLPHTETMSTTSITSSSTSSVVSPIATSTDSVNPRTTFLTVFVVTIVVLFIFGLLPMYWYLRKRRKALQELKDTMQDLDEAKPIVKDGMQDLDEAVPIVLSPDVYQTVCDVPKPTSEVKYPTPSIPLPQPKSPPSITSSLLSYLELSSHSIPRRTSTFASSTVLPTAYRSSSPPPSIPIQRFPTPQLSIDLSALQRRVSSMIPFSNFHPTKQSTETHTLVPESTNVT